MPLNQKLAEWLLNGNVQFRFILPFLKNVCDFKVMACVFCNEQMRAASYFMVLGLP